MKDSDFKGLYFVKTNFNKGNERSGKKMKPGKSQKLEISAKDRFLAKSHRLIVSEKVGTPGEHLCRALNMAAHSRVDFLEVNVKNDEMHLICREGTVVVKYATELQAKICRRIRDHGTRVKLYKLRNTCGLIFSPKG